MAEASVPVDLFNPGQVFACLGFLEAADALCGNAEGGFDWTDEADVRFRLRSDGEDNLFAIVLGFLAEATIHCRAPAGFEDIDQDVLVTDSFPSRQGDRMALPIRLEAAEHRSIDLSHWSDGSGRRPFKLYSGNRSASQIARAMLHGKRKKPTKATPEGELLREGLASLWERRRDELTAMPFDVVTDMGGSFNFDPRGGWTALDAGYSPNQHRHHGVAASPVVEVLAAAGLEHARPDEYETRQVRYGAWGDILPPMLARPALAGTGIGVPLRTFRFVLARSGKNKVVTFAQEERTP